MGLSGQVKTLICVAIAGVIFITAVYYDIRYLFIVAAFFDWLPLPTGWMKIRGGGLRRPDVLVHTVITAAAYAIGIAWVVGVPQLRIYFLIVWWLAVMAGTYVMIPKEVTT